jgi:hypothetical protein
MSYKRWPFLIFKNLKIFGLSGFSFKIRVYHTQRSVNFLKFVIHKIQKGHIIKGCLGFQMAYRLPKLANASLSYGQKFNACSSHKRY